MIKKPKKFLKKMKKRIQNPKYGHFHIRKSLVIGLLSSCAILLSSTINNSYADNNTSLLLKNHFQKTTEVVENTDKMMNDVLHSIEAIQTLKNKYIEIIESDLKENLGKLSKGEIAAKLSIVSQKIKAFSYDEIITNDSKKEKFAQLSALKHVLYSMYDNNHYSKNVNLDSLLGE
jgi:ribosome-binding protein aMBF1 (putative translation factor)